MVLFIALVLSVFAALYGYTGWRILAPLRLGPLGNGGAGAAILMLMLSPWLLRVRHLALPAWIHDRLTWVAYVVLGFFVLTALVLAARDLCWLALAAGQRLAAALGWQSVPAAGDVDPARRQFLLNALNVGALTLSTTMVGCGLRNARHDLRTESVTVHIEGLPPGLEGLRILQLSDLHVGLTIRRDFVERVVAHCRSLPADLIALTGDLVDGDVADLRRDVAPLAQLRAPLGCYFVTGNHEYYNSDPQAWLAEFRRMGFTVLLNEHRVVRHQGAELVLAGVTDFNAGAILASHRPDPQQAFAAAPASAIRLLLAHQPRSIEAAARAGCHLQLSGHTHGGQFVPWNYAVALQQPYIAGLHRHGATWVYVNRGAGYWGPPLRLGVPSEITLLTLSGARA